MPATPSPDRANTISGPYRSSNRAARRVQGVTGVTRQPHQTEAHRDAQKWPFRGEREKALARRWTERFCASRSHMSPLESDDTMSSDRRSVRGLRRPAVWGFLYLALVPVFAFQYAQPSARFTQTTVRAEPGSLDTAEQLPEMIQSDVAAFNPSFSLDGEVIEIGTDCTFQSPDVQGIGSEQQVSVLVACVAYGARPPRSSIFRLALSSPVFELVDGGVMHFGRVIADDGNQDSPRPTAAAFLGDRQDTPVATLKPATEQALGRFIAGISGDPSALAGSWTRFAYVSVVVVTTLGLGDISPANSRARLLVSIEALLGVMFAGMFLSTVASKHL